MASGRPFKYDRLEGERESSDESHHGSGKSRSRGKYLVSIPFRHLIRITVSLPLGSFLFNIFYVMYVDFQEATNTLCYDHRVIPNYLPSFSAVVGLFRFAQILWNVAIALHAAPRFLFLAMTHSYLETIVYQKYIKWVRLIGLLGVIENMGLILLTYVTSKANFSIHMWSFISFVLASEFYMLIYCLLLKYGRNIPSTHMESRSLHIKWGLMVMNISCAVLSALVYARHVTKCEVGVYTIFAFLEYIVVLTNMGFHGSAYYDFYDRSLVI